MKKNDRVSVIDDDLIGIVVSVQGNSVVVMDDYGFRHIYDKQQLVKREADLYDNLQPILKPETQPLKSKKHQKNHLVLDLHFERLVKNPENYDSFERLFLQREKLMECIDYCRKNNLKKLEIIHGIGDGTLQNMVYEVLNNQTGLEFRNTEILHHQSGSVVVELR